MKSKIRVEYDFDKKEPYLQFYVVDTNTPGTELDMRDTMLKHLVQTASGDGGYMYATYPENNQDNSVMQVRVGKNPPHEEIEKQAEEYTKKLVDEYTTNPTERMVITKFLEFAKVTGNL